MGSISFSMRDYDNEPSTMTVPSADLLETNIVAEYANAVALQTALQDVSLGNLTRRIHTAISSPQGLVGPAALPVAQREAKAMLIWGDSITFETGNVELPVVDLTKQMVGYPGFFYLVDHSAEAHADWQTFANALNAVLTAWRGNPTVLQRAYHIGKAL